MEHKDSILDEEIVKDDVQEVVEEETTEDNVVDIEEKLEEKILRDEIDTLNDQYKRLQAEYANYRRRTQQEKETIGIFANEKILNELIPVIDSMERALDACTDKEDTMFKGVELVYKQLKDMMTKFGVEEIEAEDTENEYLHEDIKISDNLISGEGNDCGIYVGNAKNVLLQGNKIIGCKQAYKFHSTTDQTLQE